jgi:hypothetical protein
MDGAGLGVLLQWAFSRDAREHVPLKLGGGGLGSVAVLPEVGGVFRRSEVSSEGGRSLVGRLRLRLRDDGRVVE